jgi:hypothetical protein
MINLLFSKERLSMSSPKNPSVRIGEKSDGAEEKKRAFA